MPPGFRYRTDLISRSEEEALVAKIAALELRPFAFHGHLGNRRVISFGSRYDFSKSAVEVAEAIPTFLVDLRSRIASFAGREAEQFQQVGIQGYSVGASIGWHKDRPQFDEIVGGCVAGAGRELSFAPHPTNQTWLATIVRDTAGAGFVAAVVNLGSPLRPQYLYP